MPYPFITQRFQRLAPTGFRHALLYRPRDMECKGGFPTSAFNPRSCRGTMLSDVGMYRYTLLAHIRPTPLFHTPIPE